MKRRLAACTLVACLLGATPLAFGQALPTSQPKFINVVRESVKLGRDADHAKHEAAWPAAYEKAKAPMPYIALASLTGAPETWYVTPYESHVAWGENMKREDADPVLSAELQRLVKADAEYLSEIRFMQAMARPDLSHGSFPDLAKTRFYSITVFRVKPGHDSAFAAAAKAYAAAASRSAPHASWRTYQVLAGLPSPTFLVFSSYETFGDLDRSLEEGMAMSKSFPADDLLALQKFNAEGLISAETNRYRLDPTQSYVGKEVRDKDPAFWTPKPAAAKVPARKPASN
jgi:hypothetical protein